MECPADPLTLHHLLKQLYQTELLKLDEDTALDAATKNEEKVKILSRQLQQTEEQLDLLLETVVELEQEASQRVIQMEKRLKTTAKTTRETVLNLHDYELEMKRLVKERLEMESALMNMHQHVSCAKDENSFLQDQNMNLNHDIQSLLHIIQQARLTGHWEMDCVTFCEVTPEQVFGPVQSLVNMSPPASCSPLPNDAIRNQTENSKSSQNYSEKCPSTGKTSSSFAPCCRFEESNISVLRRSYSSPIRHRLEDTNGRKTLSKSCSSSKKRCNNYCKENNISDARNVVFNDKLSPSHSLMQLSNGSNPIRLVCSEPHLFMLGDSIYVYKPCEPLQKVASSGSHVFEECQIATVSCQSAELKIPENEQNFINRKPLRWDCYSKVSAQCDMMEIYPSSSASHSSDLSNCVHSSTNNTPLRTNWNQLCSNESTPLKKCSTSSTYAQTDVVRSTTIGLQADIDNGDLSSVDLSAKEINKFDLKDVKSLQESVIRANDKAAAHAMLLQELQSHLNSKIQEVEMKDTVLKNIERKLDNVRTECRDLRVEISIHKENIEDLTKQLDQVKDVNNNLQTELKSKETVFEDWAEKEKNWQQQKRMLMTQLDAQGDELESLKIELQNSKKELENSVIQLDQQSNIIRSLQAALVQSKRAFDEIRPNVSTVVNGDIHSKSIHSSRSSIQDL